MVLIGLIILLFGGFFIYTLDYYRADSYVVEAFSSDTTSVETLDDMMIFYPDASVDQQIGMIFYPGGKVEALAYAPLLDKLSQKGITCVLLPMPFNLAVFDINAADRVYDAFPDIQHWYLAGHSLGGAMASSYDGKNEGKLDGLVLLGAYPVVRTNTPTLVIYGSEDLGLDMEKLEGTENKLEIVGGNHAYFGNYGEQKGDGTATITRDEQQSLAVEAIIDFIK